MAPTSRKTFIVSGRVHGVGYRYFASAAARRHEMLGFARNLADGQVKVVVEGEPEALIAFRKELELGPAPSRVDAVTESESEPGQLFTVFNIF